MILAWIGNLFIVIGLWGIGSKQRKAFIASIIGEACWIVSAALSGNWALFTICWVFLFMAVRGYILWGK